MFLTRELFQKLTESCMPPVPIEPFRCICGAAIGHNQKNCHWCREYFALTCDLTRRQIEKDTQSISGM